MRRWQLKLRNIVENGGGGILHPDLCARQDNEQSVFGGQSSFGFCSLY
jgi:hypothetical protein